MALGDIDLNLLVTLDALLAERNVTRAGRRLNVSQSTVSDALARLRRMLGDPLLVRVGREMQLTPRAEGLRDELHDTLHSIERMVRDRPIDRLTARGSPRERPRFSPHVIPIVISVGPVPPCRGDGLGI